MNLLQYLKPYNDNHSIKEAVITVFLNNKLNNLQDFELLLNNPLKFDRFSLIKQHEIALETEKGKVSVLKAQELGFEFFSMEGGKYKKALRGINQDQNNLIAFHNLVYDRWTPFKEEFYRVVEPLVTIQNDLEVEAFGIYYVDDFFWRGEDNIDLTLVFKEQQDIIPKHFFQSENSFFSLITEQKKYGLPFMERFDIKVDPSPKTADAPSIRLMHNVTQKLPQIVSLKEFLSNDYHKQLIQKSHDYNKTMIANILTQEVQKMINLK